MLFATAKDGAVRAYDANTGKVLWTGRLPRGAEGLPAMYQVDGRQYLVVTASTNLTFGREARAVDRGRRRTACRMVPAPTSCSRCRIAAHRQPSSKAMAGNGRS